MVLFNNIGHIHSLRLEYECLCECLRSLKIAIYRFGCESIASSNNLEVGFFAMNVAAVEHAGASSAGAA